VPTRSTELQPINNRHTHNGLTNLGMTHLCTFRQHRPLRVRPECNDLTGFFAMGSTAIHNNAEPSHFRLTKSMAVLSKRRAAPKQTSIMNVRRKAMLQLARTRPRPRIPAGVNRNGMRPVSLDRTSLVATYITTCSISWKEDLLQRSLYSIRSKLVAPSVAGRQFSRFDTEISGNCGHGRSYSQACTPSFWCSPFQPMNNCG
jgi:hypothetical protein